MGCCLFAILLAGAPRLAFLVWWLFQPARMSATFNTIIWPLLGVIFVPWTTFMYVIVYPGGVNGFDWFWLGLALVIDIATYGGNARARQQQTRTEAAVVTYDAPVQAPAEPQAPETPQASDDPDTTV
jgi:hypothetical protein